MSVYNKILHERGLRLLGGIVGAAIMASAINLFIVPQGFYAGGAYGLCQVIRTLLVTRAGVNVPFDLAGLLYLLANLPMFYLAYRGLGRTFFAKATIVTVCNSIFSALIPSPAVPIIADPLTSCLIGGLGVGFAAGLVLSCGCSTGGLDILGLYLSKKNPKFTVGRFCICFNVCLYTLCLFLFNATTAIYSAIYNILSNLFLDKLHQQNVNVEMLIFTKKNNPELVRFIIEKLDRGVTYWTAHGAYTGDEVQVLCVSEQVRDRYAAAGDAGDGSQGVLHRAGGRPHRRQLPAASELIFLWKHPPCRAGVFCAVSEFFYSCAISANNSALFCFDHRLKDSLKLE